jgi:hypothetical protein
MVPSQPCILWREVVKKVLSLPERSFLRTRGGIMRIPANGLNEIKPRPPHTAKDGPVLVAATLVMILVAAGFVLVSSATRAFP